MIEQERFETWGIVEVMGHSKFAGFISEQAFGGTSFVRVDVPDCKDRPAFTKLLGSGSIFGITPTTEETARAAAERFRALPLNAYDMPTRTVEVPRLEMSEVVAMRESNEADMDIDDYDDDKDEMHDEHDDVVRAQLF